MCDFAWYLVSFIGDFGGKCVVRNSFGIWNLPHPFLKSHCNTVMSRKALAIFSSIRTVPANCVIVCSSASFVSNAGQGLSYVCVRLGAYVWSVAGWRRRLRCNYHVTLEALPECGKLKVLTSLPNKQLYVVLSQKNVGKVLVTTYTNIISQVSVWSFKVLAQCQLTGRQINLAIYGIFNVTLEFIIIAPDFYNSSTQLRIFIPYSSYILVIDYTAT